MSGLPYLAISLKQDSLPTMAFAFSPGRSASRIKRKGDNFNELRKQETSDAPGAVAALSTRAL